MDLSGRRALVTGGAGHIGLEIARGLAGCGARVALVDRQEEACRRAARGLEPPGEALACDLADEAALRAAAEEALERLGGLEILVHCAAFVGDSKLEGWVTPFAQQRPEAWRAALEVNLTAPFLLTQALAPALAAGGAGSVVMVGSIYGVVGPDLRLYEGTAMGNPAAYAASKGGLVQLARWLATVLAPAVRVNSLSLGGVWRGQPESFVRRYTARTPLGRMATESDAVGAVLFLASDLSSSVTGQNLMVDGGYTAW
jgi:NAD(P)-dependent dehydrogenase (short-subunit alcohol dehydrogenase family)